MNGSSPFPADPSELECPLAGVLAGRLRRSRKEITAHWLARIADRVTIEPNRIFPTNELLDHVPLLIDGIANYVEDPAKELGVDTPVLAKAMELGALRHAQGFDAYQILKEYEILGGIIFTHLARSADEIPEPCDKKGLLFCGQRVFKAVTLIQQATTTHFLRLADQRVAEREDRLRAFNRSISHEIKNRIGAVLGASEVLRETTSLAPEQERFVAIISNNARLMRTTVENLLALSHMDKDARQHRNVLLPEAAAEAVRQVREAAAEAGVQLSIGELPSVEVDAAAVELCLTNYLSNAIKYANRKQHRCVAEVDGTISSRADGTSEVVVRVRDNGLGVPVGERNQLFGRFFRSQSAAESGQEGTGLGLSIVRETVESLGGRAWAEFSDQGTVFAFSLPYRRDGEKRTQQAADEDKQPTVDT